MKRDCERIEAVAFEARQHVRGREETYDGKARHSLQLYPSASEKGNKDGYLELDSQRFGPQITRMTMMDFYARVEADRERGGFVVTFPDLGHGATQGETLQEAEEMACDLLRSIIGELIKRGKGVPAPLKHRGKGYLRVILPALETAKLELYSAFRSSGIKKAELARRIGIPKAQIDRLFDFDHPSRLDQLEAALRAVGKRIEVRVSNAA